MVVIAVVIPTLWVLQVTKGRVKERGVHGIIQMTIVLPMKIRIRIKIRVRHITLEVTKQIKGRQKMRVVLILGVTGGNKELIKCSIDVFVLNKIKHNNK